MFTTIVLPSSISGSGGVGVGFGLSTGAGGGSPSEGAIRSTGVGADLAGGVGRGVAWGVGVGVDVAGGRSTVWFVGDAGAGVGRGAIAVLRRGRESCVLAETRVDPTRQLSRKINARNKSTPGLLKQRLDFVISLISPNVLIKYKNQSPLLPLAQEILPKFNLSGTSCETPNGSHLKILNRKQTADPEKIEDQILLARA